MRLRPVFALMLFVSLRGVVAAPLALLHAEESIQGKPALPGQTCQLAPHPDWTPPEQWVWKQVCEGKIADFNTADRCGGWLTPKNVEGWLPCRVLKPAFLKTMMLHEPYRGAVPHQGIRIRGAWFKAPLDLSYSQLVHPLVLENSRFAGLVDLRHVRTPYAISLRDSVVSNKLWMNNIHVDSDLDLEGAMLGETMLQAAKVEGSLNMSRGAVSGKLWGRSLHVGNDVRMDNATFDQVELQNARIQGQLDMRGSAFTRGLWMEDAQIASHQIMSGATFGQEGVGMQAVQIGGDFVLKGSTVAGSLKMPNLQVGNNFSIDGGRLTALVLRQAHIAGSLVLHKATITGAIQMEATEVRGSVLVKSTRVDGTLNMQGMHIDNFLLVKAATFADIELQGAAVQGLFGMDETTVNGTLNLSFTQIGHALSLRKGTFAKVMLAYTRTGGPLFISEAAVTGRLDMRGLQVGGQLSMSEGNFSEIDLQSATIEGEMDLNGATVSGSVHMDSLEVGSSLFMRNSALTTVDLRFAKVGGQLEMDEATISGLLAMDGLHVQGDLLMRWGTFEAVALHEATIGAKLDMLESTVSGKLDMTNLQVDGDLYLDGKATFAEVLLQTASIGGLLSMIGATVRGPLNMANLRVHGDLYLRDGATFDAMHLYGAEISGQLDLSRATVSGTLHMGTLRVKRDLLMEDTTVTNVLDMDGLQVGGSLIMHHGSFTKVLLRGAIVGSQLLLNDSAFSDKVDMMAVHVGHDLQIQGSTFIFAETPVSIFKETEHDTVTLTFAEIDLNLALSDTILHSLDLTGTHIRGELRLTQADRPVKWQKGARLTLRNTKVETLQETPEAWPDTLKLDGFTYDRLSRATAVRSDSWFKEWLEKQKSYSPQPYEQLAKVLREAGHREKARKILYAGKKREHAETTETLSLTWWWLFLQQIFIGYGYRIHYALFWSVGLILLGMVVLRCSGQAYWRPSPQPEARADRTLCYWGLAYSLDMLLPVIELRKYHYDKIDLEGWPRVYFYVHKLLGYVLAFFLIAGLSGLAK